MKHGTAVAALSSTYRPDRPGLVQTSTSKRLLALALLVSASLSSAWIVQPGLDYRNLTGWTSHGSIRKSELILQQDSHPSFGNGAALAATPTLPPGVSTKNPVKYRVRMRTKVVVPTKVLNCQQIRVWHALPTTRLWSRVTRVPGVVSLSYLPKTGRMEFEDDRLSAHVYFEENAAFKPGQIRYYQSDYEVFSCDRKFEIGSRAVTWRMYTAKDFNGIEPLRTVDPDISALADQLKGRHNPVDFVIESCKWIRANIKYDASVTYQADDGPSIMRNKRGHCGHQQTVLKQLCARAGIPYKGVLGLDLYSANGIGELSALRGDYANAHTWSQVYFPGIGWIEVDTVEGAKCFEIDKRFIQNNTAFENYAVWVQENDETREAEWQFVNGRFVCDYGIENLITFSQTPG